jgi:glycosyltransferase involved in cell wall biosynthesis
MTKTSSAKSLTVLHIAPTPFFADRGCHMRIRGMINALNKIGVRNLLCTYHHGNNVEGIEAIRIGNIPGYQKLESGPSAYKYLADIMLLMKVCGIIWREHPDVIHGHLHEGVLIGWLARWVFFWRRLPVIFDVQGSLVGELDAHGYFRKLRLLRVIYKYTEWLITKMPSHFICSSSSSLEILKKEFSVPRKKLTLVSDGADVTTTDPGVVHDLKMQLGLPETKPIVIFTGALLEAKGFIDLCDLIELAAELKGEISCHFLIVGYPVEALQKFLSDKGLESWCTLTGRVPYEKLSNYLALARVAIEPKAADSGEASGKLLNYMAASLPVVCYDSLNNREMLADGGYYAKKCGASGALLICLKEALDSPKEASQRGRFAKFRVQDLFSWDTEAVKILDIYNKKSSIL